MDSFFIMQSLKGKILVATPDLLSDHIFSQAVIYIIEHIDAGAMGFIINKPLNLNLRDNVKNTTTKYLVWDGGPVHKENIFFLHNRPDLPIVNDIIDRDLNIYLGSNRPEDFKLIFSNIINPENIKFFLGYSGWDSEQLDREIKEKAWFVYPNLINIFDANTKNLWKKLIVEINPKNIIWKNAPQDPSLN